MERRSCDTDHIRDVSRHRYPDLVMMVGDPFVYLIWRKFPAFVPVDKYPFIAFAGLINVEKASDGALPDKTPK
jgi:hypothetical protein